MKQFQAQERPLESQFMQDLWQYRKRCFGAESDEDWKEVTSVAGGICEKYIGTYCETLARRLLLAMIETFEQEARDG